MPEPENPDDPGQGTIDAFRKYELRCSQCRFIASTPETLTTHLNSSHKKDLCHFCKDCGRPFEKIDMLVRHMTQECTKNNIYNLECGFQDCNFSHSEPNEFASHMKVVHKGKSLMPCKRCQQQFTLPFCLIRHMQEQCVHRPENWIAYPQNPSKQRQNNSTANNSGSTTAFYNRSGNLNAGPSNVTAKVPSNRTGGQAVVVVLPKVVTVNLCNNGSTISNNERTVTTSSAVNVGAGPSNETRPLEVIKTIESSKAGSAIPSDSKKVAKITKRRPFERKLSTSSSDESWGKGHRYNQPFDDSSDSEPDDPLWKPEKSARHRGREMKAKSLDTMNDRYTNKQNGFPMESTNSTEGTPTTNGPEASTNGPKVDQLTVEDLESSNSESDDLESSDDEAGPLEPSLFRDWTAWASTMTSVKKDMSLCSEKIKHFFKCMYEDCVFTSDEEEAFEKHLTEHETDSISCTYCFKTFQVEELVAHMVVRHGNRIHQCSRCLYRSVTKVQANIHIKEVHNHSAESLKCTQLNASRTRASSPEFFREGENYFCIVKGCGFDVENESLYEKHYSDVHPNMKEYPCFQCDEKLGNISSLTEHLRAIHGFNDYQCVYCNFGTRKEANILNHVCINHADFVLEIRSRYETSLETLEKPLKTPECDDNNKENILTPQTKINRPVVENSYMSAETESSMPLKDRLKYYDNYDRDFFCGINNCQKLIKNIHFYRKHLQSAHGSTSNYPCPHCKEISNSYSSAEHHLKLHGPNLYLCASSSSCGFYHWNKDLLIEHKCNKSEKRTPNEVLTVREMENAVATSLASPHSSSEDLSESETHKSEESPPELTIQKLVSPKKEKLSESEEDNLNEEPFESTDGTKIIISSVVGAADFKSEIEYPSMVEIELEVEPELLSIAMPSSLSILENDPDSGISENDAVSKATDELTTKYNTGGLTILRPKTRLAKSREISANISPPEPHTFIQKDLIDSEGTVKASPPNRRKRGCPQLDITDEENYKCKKIKTEITLECNHCPMRFLTISEAQMHLKNVHHRAFTYKCLHCDTICIKKSRILQHVEIHKTKASDQAYGYVHFNILSTNDDVSDSKQIKTHFCIFCGTHITDKESFRAHMYEELRYKPFQCGGCMFQARKRSFVEEHIRNNHKGANVSIKENIKIVLEHMVEDYISSKHRKRNFYPTKLLGGPLKTWQCCMCLYSASTKLCLNTHLKSHLSYKPFSCSICGQSSDIEAHIKAHILKNHKKGFVESLQIEALDEWIEGQITKLEKFDSDSESSSKLPLRFSPLSVRNCVASKFSDPLPSTSKAHPEPLESLPAARKVKREKTFARKSTGGTLSRKGGASNAELAAYSFYRVKAEPINMNKVFMLVAGDIPGSPAVRVPLWCYMDKFFNLRLKIKDFRIF